MNDEETDPVVMWASIAILSVIVVSLVIGIGFEIYVYATADKVECNWLWCTFTTERTNITETRFMSQHCYTNSVEVNCT